MTNMLYDGKKTCLQGACIIQERAGLTRVGCPENAKSLKSQAPQGFSGCLDIDNDEMNKKKFLSASPRVN